MKFFSSLTLGMGALLSSLSLQAWAPPALISEGPAVLTPTSYSLTIDQYSNATIAYLEGDIGSATDMLSVCLPANAPHWNAPISLFSDWAEYPAPPLLFSDDNGNTHAVWANFIQNSETLLFDELTISHSTQNVLGSYWNWPQTYYSFSGFTAGGDGSVDQEGNCLGMLALSTDSATYTGPYELYMISLPSGEGYWNTPVYLDTDTGSGAPVVFSRASEGSGIIGWKVSSSLALHTARYDFDSNTLTNIEDVTLPAGTVDVNAAHLAFSANGNATLVFTAKIGDEANYILYASFLPEGSSSWTLPEIISNPDNMAQSYMVSLKTDENSDGILLWAEGTEEGVFIRAGALPFGESIEDTVDLTDSMPAETTVLDYRSGLTLSVDKFGNALAAWELNIDGNFTVQVTSKEAWGSWEEVETLSTTGSAPAVALSDQGTAVVAWTDNTSGALYATTNNTLFSLDAPLNFAGYVAMDFYGNLTLNMHWIPSQAPNIVNYELFKDGELIATISGEGPYTFSQSIECEMDVYADYELVAVASNGNTSEPVEFTLTE